MSMHTENVILKDKVHFCGVTLDRENFYIFVSADQRDVEIYL